MTAEKHAETPVSHLATALAAFQAALPTVTKGTAGQVRGNPNYRYADLADLNGAVLPKLAAFGLSFSCKPTVAESGRFVLAYVLRHSSGESDSGEYPLPDDVSPQDMGSAQTYARRYVLQAMTGVAPDGQDDDGAAATRAYSHRGQSGQQPRNGTPATAPEPPAAPIVSKEAREALEELAALCDAMTLDRELVAAEFARRHNGADVRKASTPEAAGLVRAFIAAVDDMDPTKLKRPVAATNGVPA
jgi:hypothetical protein